MEFTREKEHIMTPRQKLMAILRGGLNVDELDGLREEIAEFMPGIRVMFDYDQHNRAHQYDLWKHTLHVITDLPRELDDDMIYVGALLHDIGKPDCCCMSGRPGDTDHHFYNHPKRSHEIVRDVIIGELEAAGVGLTDNDKYRLLFYVGHHDDHLVPDTGKIIAEFRRNYPEDMVRNLIYLEYADSLEHVQQPRIEARTRAAAELIESWSQDIKSSTD